MREASGRAPQENRRHYMEFVFGVMVGFVVGVLVIMVTLAGGTDAIVKMYADKQRLYRVGDKAYEIKEV